MLMHIVAVDLEPLTGTVYATNCNYRHAFDNAGECRMDRAFRIAAGAQE